MVIPFDKNISGWYNHSPSSPFRDHSNMNSARGVSLAFPLPASNFVPARMAMTVVYPRPDNETQTHARHRLMHTTIDYLGTKGHEVSDI